MIESFRIVMKSIFIGKEAAVANAITAGAIGVHLTNINTAISILLGIIGIVAAAYSIWWHRIRITELRKVYPTHKEGRVKTPEQVSRDAIEKRAEKKEDA